MKFFIFDTETTALIHNSLIKANDQPRVIEFYGHLVNEKGKVLDELEFMCNPATVVDEKITEITGITHDMVADKPFFKSYANSIQAILAKADAAVAHNLKYDHSVLSIEFRRIPQRLIWPKRLICTVEMSEYLAGYRLSLGDLYEHLFKRKFDNAHRAKPDVKALTQCFFALRELENV